MYRNGVCIYIYVSDMDGEVLKYFPSFSKPAVTTVNKILLLVKCKVNSSSLKQLLSIFRQV